LAIAVEANRHALTLAVSRYKQGLSNFVEVLTDEQNLLNAQQQNIQSTQMATTNMVELYKALGGGWETEFPAVTK
jgi:outer membrane protein TolC